MTDLIPSLQVPPAYLHKGTTPLHGASQCGLHFWGSVRLFHAALSLLIHKFPFSASLQEHPCKPLSAISFINTRRKKRGQRWVSGREIGRMGDRILEGRQRAMEGLRSKGSSGHPLLSVGSSPWGCGCQQQSEQGQAPPCLCLRSFPKNTTGLPQPRLSALQGLILSLRKALPQPGSVLGPRRWANLRADSVVPSFHTGYGLVLCAFPFTSHCRVRFISAAQAHSTGPNTEMVLSKCL